MNVDDEIRELSGTYAEYKEEYHDGQHSLAILAQWKKRVKRRNSLIRARWDGMVMKDPQIRTEIWARILKAKKKIDPKNTL